MCGWVNPARAPISCLKNLLAPPLNSFFANLNPNHVVSWTTPNPPLPSNWPPDKSLGLTQKMRGEEVKPLESMAMSEGFTFGISCSLNIIHQISNFETHQWWRQGFISSLVSLDSLRVHVNRGLIMDHLQLNILPFQMLYNKVML